MKLHLYYYECNNCKNIFKSPQLSGNPYGEFLMRSTAGDIVYLDSFKDKVFDEIETFFKKTAKADQLQNTAFFQEIFSVVCDVDYDGFVYRIRQKPPCPKCGKINIGHWGPTNPPEIIDVDVPIVTHEKWNKLSESEKKSRINDAIEKLSKNKDDFGIL
ncbi:MAG: hypothetical protein NTZ67_09760 [Gammaproteobacteria bacterium]|nr:hypothetical protein [Gammaproteobacteria bacterium]